MPRDHLFIENLINLGLVSPTQALEERKKKRKDGLGLHFTGLELDTRNHYQRARGKDQNGTYSPWIDEPRSLPFQIS